MQTVQSVMEPWCCCAVPLLENEVIPFLLSRVVHDLSGDSARFDLLPPSPSIVYCVLDRESSAELGSFFTITRDNSIE